MITTTVIQIYVFVLAGFVGFLVITRVPPLLHTPLMSATNAISGISLVGSLVAAGAGRSMASTILGTVAVGAATINVVGGFIITDRMLRMFKRAPKATMEKGGGDGKPALGVKSDQQPTFQGKSDKQPTPEAKTSAEKAGEKTESRETER